MASGKRENVFSLPIHWKWIKDEKELMVGIRRLRKDNGEKRFP